MPLVLAREGAPLILAREGAHGPVVHAASPAALARGVREGARVVDAQAVHPDLRVEPADPEGDRAALDRLALWARRWGPWSAREGEGGVALDATGVAHLFGGEGPMLADIERRLAARGLTARPAMAPTRGAARALARHDPGAICGPEDVEGRLAPLPVRALGIGEDAARLLDRLGLKTIGALAGVPRAALMRRFATAKADRNPLVLLDRAAGRLPEPLGAPPLPARFEARARLSEPALDPLPHLPDLAHRLCAALARSGRGARALRLTAHRVDGERRAAHAATARATRDPAHLLRLLDAEGIRIDPGFGFDLLTLEAPRTEPLALGQEGLDGTRSAEADLAALLDRLAARLGSRRVTWSAWRESHLPERVEKRRPALDTAPSAPPASGPVPALGPVPAPGPSPAFRSPPPAWSAVHARAAARGRARAADPPARPGRGGAGALRRARRAARALRVAPRGPPHHPPRGARADRARMVARAPRHAAARLLQGRGRGRAALLALSRGAGGRRARRR